MMLIHRFSSSLSVRRSKRRIFEYQQFCRSCTVRKLTQLVLLSVALLATPAFAEMKVAVLNYQMALLESDAAKRIQDRLVKDGEKMQTAERERLELEFKQKARDFQFQSKELNESKAVADREMLKKLKPNLDKAVEEVIKTGNFDLVLERGAVIDVKPQFDITRQVIERMNQLR